MAPSVQFMLQPPLGHVPLHIILLLQVQDSEQSTTPLDVELLLDDVDEPAGAPPKPPVLPILPVPPTPIEPPMPPTPEVDVEVVDE